MPDTASHDTSQGTTGALRQPLDEPRLTLDPAFHDVDMFGDPYEYPAEEHVRWDIGMGCSFSVVNDHDPESNLGLHVVIGTGVDFPKSGFDRRQITTDQIRRFACRLIALAEHIDRAEAGE